MSRMTEVAMPKRRPRVGDQGVRSRQTKRVQRPRAIAPDDHVPRLKILHRTTSQVKLNRAIVIESKLANGNKILNKLWRDQNIIKM